MTDELNEDEAALLTDVSCRLCDVMAAQPISYELSLRALATATGYALGALEAELENTGASADEMSAAVTSGMLLFVLHASECQSVIYQARRKKGKGKAKKPTKRAVLKAVEEMLGK